MREAHDGEQSAPTFQKDSPFSKGGRGDLEGLRQSEGTVKSPSLPLCQRGKLFFWVKKCAC